MLLATSESNRSCHWRKGEHSLFSLSFIVVGLAVGEKKRVGASTMRELTQSLRTGEIEVVQVPCAAARTGQLLVQTCVSLISAGTERMLVEFGKAGLVQKARQQPDKVREAIDKIRTDGLLSTVHAVRSKLDQPLAMGYCNVGTVLEVGAGVDGFRVGDRVVSNGNHAEVVSVAKNLCAKVPANVSEEAAALAVVGAIGLQGIRLAAPTLGETFVVSGLGLIGLLTVQLLRAQGCRVLGMDFEASRLALARDFGAETVDLSSGEDPLPAARAFSRGRGVDGVLITAATKSDQPVHLAAQMCRKRGRIVLVGAVGLHLSRADFYEKELSFQVSCSYGPGRYDPQYEQQGIDYPTGFVRWTARRNFEAVLDMMSEEKLATSELITHRFPLEQAPEAYDRIVSKSPCLGVILKYPRQAETTAAIVRQANVRLPVAERSQPSGNAPVVSFVGAGNYAMQMLIPAFKKNDVQLRHVVSRRGLTAVHAARKFGFAEATTDFQSVLADPSVDVVVIATRHDTHAQFVCEALQAKKHVFVEKPLALNSRELAEIQQCYQEVPATGGRQVLSMGFNRRFAPQVQKMAELLREVAEPKTLVMTVNAGFLPPEHWLHDRQLGGGRIVGEACHFIDLLRFLCDHEITALQAAMLEPSAGGTALGDKVTFTLRFADGSCGTIHYLANGHRAFPKERLEVFCAGRVLQLDNFRKLRGYGWPRFKRMNLRRQDKGHVAGVQAFLQAVGGAASDPLSLAEMVEVTRVSFDVLRAAENGETIEYHWQQASSKAA